jgi:hypothetical protein
MPRSNGGRRMPKWCEEARKAAFHLLPVGEGCSAARARPDAPKTRFANAGFAFRDATKTAKGIVRHDAGLLPVLQCVLTAKYIPLIDAGIR